MQVKSIIFNISLINILGKTLSFKSWVTLGLSLLCSCSFTYHYTRLHTFFGNFWPSIKLLILISKETKETLKFQVLSNQIFLKYLIPFRCLYIISWLHILTRKMPLSCRTTKIATSNDRNGITSKKPGTVLSMQNVDGILRVIGNCLVKGKEWKSTRWQ